MGDAFFDGKAEAARLKHLILRKYLPPFISKVGYTATDGRVVIVDGYAGPGRYEDGSEGSERERQSPLLVQVHPLPRRELIVDLVPVTDVAAHASAHTGVRPVWKASASGDDQRPALRSDKLH